MVAAVPSLERSLYLKDPQSIIAYTLRRYHTTPKNTIPFLSEYIISLPARQAEFGKNPEQLVRSMQEDLQGVFGRIFAGDRGVTVSVTYQMKDSNSFDVTTSVIFTLLSGELGQFGTTISLQNGKLVIPEDNIQF